ncbi:rhodanese-like domain-containing protein [Pajaroellobacter abortibovis]|uniref:Rhodanese domain-containing protein n=1 Tax=Pajaroellobacter abortibovis TaxID=1882918 RepID=A0A1L6MZ32_9BACT|nr:rhodanese-like domain-containing protein [Pajaroellobacter abortibovis]APS00749.1 hypothetical protein BCY86_08710 [Pajaroellobacter abortibovis]
MNAAHLLPTVRRLPPHELKAKLDGEEHFLLLDVRPSSERALAHIPEAQPLDEMGEQGLMALDRATPLVFHCHHGIRSYHAAVKALQLGFQNVYNLDGGIEAWSYQVDPAVPRY